MEAANDWEMKLNGILSLLFFMLDTISKSLGVQSSLRPWNTQLHKLNTYSVLEFVLAMLSIGVKNFVAFIFDSEWPNNIILFFTKKKIYQ